jgi:hypothetical protein
LYEKEEKVDVAGTDIETPLTVQDELESIDESAVQEEGPQGEDAMDGSDTEEVNWEQLQKTEDEQVKDPDDNVRMTIRLG